MPQSSSIGEISDCFWPDSRRRSYFGADRAERVSVTADHKDLLYLMRPINTPRCVMLSPLVNGHLLAGDAGSDSTGNAYLDRVCAPGPASHQRHGSGRAPCDPGLVCIPSDVFVRCTTKQTYPHGFHAFTCLDVLGDFVAAGPLLYQRKGAVA